MGESVSSGSESARDVCLRPLEILGEWAASVEWPSGARSGLLMVVDGPVSARMSCCYAYAGR